VTLDLGRDAARGPGDGPERWAASDPGFPVPLTRFIGRPDEIGSTRFQLEFLRTCGDPAEDIARVLAVLDQAR